MDAKLLRKQTAKLEEDILDLYFLVTYFETVISRINENKKIICDVTKPTTV